MAPVVTTLPQRWKAFYRKSSIQMILSLFFTLVAVVGMVGMGLTLFLRFSVSNNALLAESSQRVLAQVNLNLDNYLRSMMRVSNTMYYSVIKDADLAEDGLNAQLGLLYENNRDFLVSIAIFSQNGELIASTPLRGLKPGADPQAQEWFTSATSKIENLHFSTPHVQNLFIDPDYRYRWVVSLSRHVELTQAGAIDGGVLLIDMNYSGIEQICKDVKISSSGYLYLIDGTGEIIYHPRQQLIYAGLLEENNLTASSYQDGSHTEKFLDEKRQVTVKTVGYTGWKLVSVVPEDNILSNYNQLILFFLFVLLFSVFLIIFINLYLSERITAPLKALDRAVKALEAGVENVELDAHGPHEIEHLSHSIRSMVSTQRHLMDDIIRQEQQKRRSELDVLQSQINPHFLYNTLDSVVWMSENGRTDEAVVMVTALARFFRISLNQGNNIISIAAELEHAHHYLTIQQMRFKNRFTAAITMEDGIGDLYTLKLIVQPILENAIYHGMAYASGDGEILVHAFRRESSVFIDITDNGPGMPPQVVERLLAHDDRRLPKKDGATDGAGIGLINVHRRIQLSFGQEYGLTIQSEPDAGTVVRLKLPALDAAQAERYRKEGGV